jgi:hypothetical protein
MRIQPTNQNFGAIKVTRQNAPKIPDFKLMNSDKMADAIMFDESAMRFILLLSKKFGKELKVGKDEKEISWNIMSDFDSFTEKEMVKRLSNVFKLKNLKLNIESVSNQSAEESAKNFAKEMSSK